MNSIARWLAVGVALVLVCLLGMRVLSQEGPGGLRGSPTSGGQLIGSDPEPPEDAVAGRPTRLSIATAVLARTTAPGVVAERFIDRETTSSSALDGSTEFYRNLEQASWVAAVKVYGAADGTLSVLAETANGFELMSGLESVPLAGLSPGWNELASATPVFTARVL